MSTFTPHTLIKTGTAYVEDVVSGITHVHCDICRSDIPLDQAAHLDVALCVLLGDVPRHEMTVAAMNKVGMFLCPACLPQLRVRSKMVAKAANEAEPTFFQLTGTIQMLAQRREAEDRRQQNEEIEANRAKERQIAAEAKRCLHDDYLAGFGILMPPKVKLQVARTGTHG